MFCFDFLCACGRSLRQVHLTFSFTFFFYIHAQRFRLYISKEFIIVFLFPEASFFCHLAFFFGSSEWIVLHFKHWEHVELFLSKWKFVILYLLQSGWKGLSSKPLGWGRQIIKMDLQFTIHAILFYNMKINCTFVY